ncbi:MAG TPA: DUF2851 family protein [Opitutaceae bacterium]|nr:DUF2851 family protein [Opitutaceae bacterium]
MQDTPVFIDTVAEMQGLDGPFSFPEKLFQKIWLRGDFDVTRAATTDGRAVRVLHPGKWNLLGGPDFKGAQLQLGDVKVRGDVEVHLHERDWAAHGHAADTAYDDVVLHVVLFPSAEKFSRGRDGRQIPVLALLPLLHRDLEEYAADDTMESLANRPASRGPEELGGLAPAELERLLRRCAEMRWRQKVHFARLRLARLGWESACHHAALEILGYRFNRAPMLRVATAWPLSAWSAGEGTADEAFDAEKNRWSGQGARPANYPRVRLRQYARWTRERPDWPARLEVLACNLPADFGANAGSTADFRRVHALARLRDRLAREICADAVGGTRLDNLVCDGFWPLLAACGADGFFAWWFHWPTGDLPPQVTGALRALGVFTHRTKPACHGFAQGMLGWLLARENFAGREGCGT